MSMCDMAEEEWPEYLLQVEAAAARARARVSRPPAARPLFTVTEPTPTLAEVGA